LAVAHAPAALRPALTTLFALDERLAGIVAATTEPTIGLIRLAWWREALERLDREEAPAEPLLQALASLLPIGVSGRELSEIEDGWAALLEGEADDAAMDRHAQARGATLFRLAGRLLGSVESDARLVDAGAGWALADLGHRHSDPDVRGRARAKALIALGSLPRAIWPRQIRPLGMLATLARADASTAGARHQGAPGRLLRMLALRFTGR